MPLLLMALMMAAIVVMRRCSPWSVVKGAASRLCPWMLTRWNTGTDCKLVSLRDAGPTLPTSACRASPARVCMSLFGQGCVCLNVTGKGCVCLKVSWGGCGAVL